MAGWGPVSWLSKSSSSRSCVSCPSSGGKGPVRRVSARFRYCSWASCPSSGGIGPVSRLPWKSSSRRPVSRPRAGGSGPTMTRYRRRRCMTRGGSPPTLTPTKCSRGVSLCHELNVASKSGSRSLSRNSSKRLPVTGQAGRGAGGRADRRRELLGAIRPAQGGEHHPRPGLNVGEVRVNPADPVFRLHAQPLVVRADARHAQLLTLPHLAQDRVVQARPGPQVHHRP